MTTYKRISPLYNLARVKAITNDGCRLFVEFQNGKTASIDGENPFNFEVGSVVLISLEEGNTQIDHAPDELWPEESWVGVVRLKLKDITVLDSGGGHWRIVNTSTLVDYKEQNTVEVKDSVGIIRMLAKEPIKYIDLPTIDDNDIKKFITNEKNKQVTFDDFGGFQGVVSRARELIELSIQCKEELKKINARPIKGVLFTGPPGTGKTMLAKIIANSTDAKFYEISGPEVISKWYGQSEEILRRLFEDAARQTHAIIFFDEIDSVASQRDGEAHEASRRVVAQLLALMDGFTSDDNVIVIAATNRPQDIDAALRRPGRFDWEINFPLPNYLDRVSILKTSGKKLSTQGNLPYEWISRNTETWTAADLTAIWSEAALLAVSDNKRSVILSEDFIGGYERVLAQKRKILQR